MRKTCIKALLLFAIVSMLIVCGYILPVNAGTVPDTSKTDASAKEGTVRSDRGGADTGSEVTFFTWDRMEPHVSAVLKAVKYAEGTEVPAGTKLYAKAAAARYLSKGAISAHSGVSIYTVSVRQRAKRSWRSEETGEAVSDAGWVMREVTLRLPWTYYTVDEFAMYDLSEVIVKSSAVKKGFKAAPAADIPGAELLHYEGEDEHVKDPAGYSEGMMITLSGTLTSRSDGYKPPEWPEIDAVSSATKVKRKLGAVRVRNDAFSFGGEAVMTDEWVEQTTAHIPDITVIVPGDVITIKSGKRKIPASKQPAVYLSSGTLKYKLKYGFSAAGTVMETELTLPLNVGPVTVRGQ